jgi:large repetitive protein
MNKFSVTISFLLFTSFIFPDLSLKAQGFVSRDSCKIPSIITPNDDGLNDELKIPCLSDDNPDSEIMIFNEWGDRVYFAKPYRNNWRGTYKSEPLPDGTYFYVFTAQSYSTVQKGSITIFR